MKMNMLEITVLSTKKSAPIPSTGASADF